MINHLYVKHTILTHSVYLIVEQVHFRVQFKIKYIPGLRRISKVLRCSITWKTEFQIIETNHEVQIRNISSIHSVFQQKQIFNPAIMNSNFISTYNISKRNCYLHHKQYQLLTIIIHYKFKITEYNMTKINKTNSFTLTLKHTPLTVCINTETDIFDGIFYQ